MSEHVFFSRSHLPEPLFVPHGDNTHEPVFSERVKNGLYEVYQSGEKNLQDVINEAYPASTIYSVLARCGIGDYSGLSNHGFFADISGMPRHIIDACATVNQSREFFDMLPKEVSSQFESFSDFVQSAGTQRFFDAFSVLNKRASAPAEKPNIEKEGE